MVFEIINKLMFIIRLVSSIFYVYYFNQSIRNTKEVLKKKKRKLLRLYIYKDVENFIINKLKLCQLSLIYTYTYKFFHNKNDSNCTV